MGRSAEPKALLAELFEAAAAAMGLDQGREHLTLEFEDGRLRRWGRTDPGNGALELARFDQAAAHELRACELAPGVHSRSLEDVLPRAAQQ